MHPSIYYTPIINSSSPVFHFAGASSSESSMSKQHLNLASQTSNLAPIPVLPTPNTTFTPTPSSHSHPLTPHLTPISSFPSDILLSLLLSSTPISSSPHLLSIHFSIPPSSQAPPPSRSRARSRTSPSQFHFSIQFPISNLQQKHPPNPFRGFLISLET
ncbi:uncharacterized protein EAF01_000848 [Botrytis porri]|uniref:uncharacterized protein n=1 Tax=Botrytis porri TaxID=87229 RepID=UPI001902921E|nr:uncharacterized protein EAF01_000848 [Botrytis porri]KAF7914442.1 hypothetical protein EAF01_000848 [Botrytis porri]